MSLSIHRRVGESALDEVRDLCRELLRLGVLQEADWSGDVGTSVKVGLIRWVGDLGAHGMQLLRPLRLEITNDAREYFTRLDDSLWREQMKAKQVSGPMGFFSLSWTAPDGHLQPVFVAKALRQIEEDCPGWGTSICSLLEMAFRWTVNGLSFHWARDLAAQSQRLLEDDYIVKHATGKCDCGVHFSDSDVLRMGRDEPYRQEMLKPLWARLPDQEALDALNEEVTEMCLPVFHHEIPEAFCTMDATLEGILGSSDDETDEGPIARMTAAARERWEALDADLKELARLLNLSSRTRVGASHLPLLCNAGRQMEPNGSVYLSMSPTDAMHRIVDDIYHFRSELMSTTAMSDICWLHGFQLGRGGKSTRADDRDRRKLRSIDRKLTPEEGRIGWSEAFAFEPDGSLEAAVKSTRRCIETCVVLDRILVRLHDPTIPRPEPVPVPRMWAGLTGGRPWDDTPLDALMRRA